MKNENLKQRNENEVTDRAKVPKFLFFIFLFLVLVASLKSVSELYLLCSELCFYFFPKPFHILTKFRLCAQQNYDFQSIIPSTDVIQLTLTLKMTTAQVVETSVTVNNNSPIQDYVHPDDQTQPFEMIPGFKPFTAKILI